MRWTTAIISFSLLAVLLALQTSVAGDGKKEIKPTQKVSGKLGDNGLAKAAPKAGYLTDQKSLDDLWTAWNLKDKAPKIDFTKEIVIVQLALGGPNVPSATYKLDASGDLTSVAISTLIGGPGFGYSLDVLPREGIKTYMGKAIVDTKEKK